MRVMHRAAALALCPHPSTVVNGRYTNYGLGPLPGAAF
jgi:hypothetical protein